MRTITVPSSSPGTLLVPAGSGTCLIMHQNAADPIVYLGDANTVNVSDTSNVVPLAAPGFIVVDGSIDVYGIAASGSATINVIDGGTSYFQPSSELVVVGANAGFFVYSPTVGLHNLRMSITSAAGTDIYGNTFGSGLSVFNAAGGMVGSWDLTTDILSVKNPANNSDVSIDPSASGFLIPTIFFNGAEGQRGWVNAFAAGTMEMSASKTGTNRVYVRATQSQGSIAMARSSDDALNGGRASISTTQSSIDAWTAGVLQTYVLVDAPSGIVQASPYFQVRNTANTGYGPIVGSDITSNANAVISRAGKTVNTTSSAAFTTTETITDTLTITAIAGKTYEIEYTGLFQSTVAGDIVNDRMRLTNTAGTSLDGSQISMVAATTLYRSVMRGTWTATVSGSQTFVVTGQRGSGSGSILRSASATNPSTLTANLVT